MFWWLLYYIFTKKSKRTQQMKVDWNWFWKVDFVDWFERKTHYIFAKKNNRNDGLPF